MGFKVGDVRTIEATITDKMVQSFAEISGDFNPIHVDEEYAKTTRFGRRIAHGMISAALISRARGMELGPGGIYLSQSLKFMAPVFIGDHLKVTLTITHMRDKGISTCSTIVEKSTGEMVVKGEAIIMDADGVKQMDIKKQAAASASAAADATKTS